jgi:hypothetical protein
MPTWGNKSSTPRNIREQEAPLEERVSAVLGAMPFLWLAVDDDAGSHSARGVMERNAISLLSNYGKPTLDAPSPEWLGRYSNRPRVRESGLWNSNHVDENYDPAFLDRLDDLVRQMEVLG